ncbi:hypothetical protein GE061_006298 [Apolygus lucorum]|uniref:Uncharacterized protein n=1 Tax=Apolygus lucorum TaxID=248454 RepID=A0A6A4IZV6_APOLU|nr:hypothetical protein GE061_006298 [Apolygus lucorum]
MKVLLLGVALLCMTQVRGEDLLHSVFDQKVKELKPNVLADQPAAQPATQAPAGPTAAPYPCDAKDVVVNGNQLVKNTLDIFADTFKIVYTAMYPESGRKDCNLGTFRCFLKEFNDVKESIQTVRNNVVSYRQRAATLSTGITNYFVNKCWTRA